MTSSDHIIEPLVEVLCTLPGIGRRSAERIALHIMDSRPEQVRTLAETIWRCRNVLKQCVLCGNYARAEHCNICTDVRRDARFLCVVEKPSDVLTIEKAGMYKGLYHVLGGRLSPLRNVGPQDLGFDALLKHIEARKPEEVIVATGADDEGEATAAYIGKLLLGNKTVKLTRLGYGLPVGTPFEFADERTIEKAMDGRREME